MSHSLFDRLHWRDPVTGSPLETLVQARTPSGVPMSAALRISCTGFGYPVVDCVARLTPALAHRFKDWLEPFGLEPPPMTDTAGFQSETTVESFGFQWTWNSAMRSEADLRWRVASRFGVAESEFAGRLILDAGAGAGDQSRWLLDHGASVISLDLSSAIEVVARKLRDRNEWFGVQADLMSVPLADEQVDLVYCEGVIQHTADSRRTVRELVRVARPGAMILATHYDLPKRWLSRTKLRYVQLLRQRLSRMDRYGLLLLCGVLACSAYVPGLRTLVRKSGTATYYDLMPDFKTTWTNTFDTYGNHTYQRHVSAETFWEYFESTQKVDRVHQDGTLLVARKV